MMQLTFDGGFAYFAVVIFTLGLWKLVEVFWGMRNDR